MERKDVESAVAENSQLRGLLGVPLGLVAIVASLGNVQWGPFRHDWAFGLAVLALGVLALGINRYYNARFGHSTPSFQFERKMLVVVVIGAPLVFLGSLLLSSRASWSLDLPVNTTAITMALMLLLVYAATVGIRVHHVVIFGTLLVVGAIPVWERGGMSGNSGLWLAGVAIIISGLLDHRLLVQRFGPARAIESEDDRAGV